MSTNHRNPFIQLAFTTTVVSALVASGTYGAYRYGKNTGYEIGLDAGIRSAVETLTGGREDIAPSSVDLNYSQLSEGLFDIDSELPSGDFNNAINTLHQNMSNVVLDELGLNSEQKELVLNNLEENKEFISIDYYKELRERRQNIQDMGSTSFIELESYSTANDFEEMVAEKFCFTVDAAIAVTGVAATSNGLIDSAVSVAGESACQFISTPILGYIADELREHGFIKDLEESQNLIVSHGRHVIADLATAQDTIEHQIERDYVTNIFGFSWLSNANIEVSATSEVKAGFDLTSDEFSIDVDPDAQLVTILLPPPEILSNTPEFSIRNERNSFFRRITVDARNDVLSDLQEQIEDIAIQRDILEQAKEEAELLMQSLFAPLNVLPNTSFEVNVVFSDTPSAQSDSELEGIRLRTVREQ